VRSTDLLAIAAVPPDQAYAVKPELTEAPPARVLHCDWWEHAWSHVVRDRLLPALVSSLPYPRDSGGLPTVLVILSLLKGAELIALHCMPYQRKTQGLSVRYMQSCARPSYATEPPKRENEKIASHERVLAGLDARTGYTLVMIHISAGTPSAVHGPSGGEM
jgi:hypothetical protein